jgi:hypothetical protein
MHGPINVKSPNNISKWQMEFNSAFKGLILEKKHKNYRRDLSISVMFMHMFCEELIEIALFGVTLLPFLPAN